MVIVCRIRLFALLHRTFSSANKRLLRRLAGLGHFGEIGREYVVASLYSWDGWDGRVFHDYET